MWKYNPEQAIEEQLKLKEKEIEELTRKINSQEQTIADLRDTLEYYKEKLTWTYHGVCRD